MILPVEPPIALSPDGTRFAVGAKAGGIEVRSASPPFALLATRKGVSLGGKDVSWKHKEGIVFSPDSRTLAVTQGHDVFLWIQARTRGAAPSCARPLTGRSTSLLPPRFLQRANVRLRTPAAALGSTSHARARPRRSIAIPWAEAPSPPAARWPRPLTASSHEIASILSPGAAVARWRTPSSCAAPRALSSPSRHLRLDAGTSHARRPPISSGTPISRAYIGCSRGGAAAPRREALRLQAPRANRRSSPPPALSVDSSAWPVHHPRSRHPLNTLGRQQAPAIHDPRTGDRSRAETPRRELRPRIASSPTTPA